MALTVKTLGFKTGVVRKPVGDITGDHHPTPVAVCGLYMLGVRRVRVTVFNFLSKF